MNGAYLAQHYAALLPKFCQLVDKFSQTLDGLRTREQELTEEDEDYNLTIDVEHRLNADDAVKRVVCRMGQKILRCAEQTFAPPGSRGLSIPKEDYRDEWVKNPRAFDPQSLWATLQENYSGERGYETGYQAAAAAMIGSFDLKQGDTLRRRADGIVLNVRCYSEEDYKGVRKIPYHAVEELRRVGIALNVFLAWAQQPIDDYHFRRWNHDRPIQSRERNDLVAGLIECVIYFRRIEYRFARELVEPLQVFLSQYGGEAWQKRS